MILKTYIVNDMQEGMELIKKELGIDAVILSTKEYKKKGIRGWFSKPKLEIVAAYDADDRPSMKQKRKGGDLPKKTQQRQLPSRSNAQSGLYSDMEMSAIENKLSRLDNTLSNFMQRIENNYSDKFTAYPKEIRSFAGKLLDNDVREEIVYDLADRVEAKVKKKNMDVKDAIALVIKDYLGKPERIDTDKKDTSVILFLGTTGVGKTTTLSKITTDIVVNKHKKAAVMTTDIYKIASTEQLKVYSDILEVPFSVVYSNDELEENMEKFSDCDVIFIDTGKSPDEEEYKTQIKDIISKLKPDEIYLVISANTNYKSCVKTLSGYSYLKDYRIIITKMDEAVSSGIIFNIRSLTDKPFSYLTYGQILTEDIKDFDSTEILNDLMKDTGKE
jgi:flagellar biosynthesis protein FlhF